MEKLPHIYHVNLKQDGNLVIAATNKAPQILAGPPPQFDGSPDNWSPESLFLASIGQCIFLSFLAMSVILFDDDTRTFI